jgi:flagellar biosynthesis component FlhA
MGRKLLAVIVAIIVAGAIFLVVQMIATMFPAFAPKNLEYMTAAERHAYFSSMPMGAYIVIALGVVLASIAAGWIATNVGKASDSNALPMIVAALLALSGLVWFFGVAPGQPWWLIVIAIILCFPFSLFGHRIARRW